MPPQQMKPHWPAPIAGPPEAQISPEGQAAFMPHLHWPFSQRSPAAQQMPPHSGPVVQLPVGPHIAPARSYGIWE